MASDNSTQPINVVTTTTGTAPLNEGPGSATALEQAVNAYLTAEIAKATTASAATQPTMPTAPADGEPQIITRPASSGPGVPALLAVGGAVIGLLSGAAYLYDRRKKK